jgi:hypothetical protein
VGRESDQIQSKTEAINAMMMIITVGSNSKCKSGSSIVNVGSTSPGVPRDERRMSERSGKRTGRLWSEREFVTSQRNVGSERAGQELAGLGNS